MFLSKADLRKPVPKRSNQPPPKAANASASGLISGAAAGRSESSASNETAEGIAERAKIERLQRQELREKTSVAVKLQTWWRWRHAQNRLIAMLSAVLAAKLADIDKVAKLLSSKGMVFVPPIPIARSLIIQMVLLTKLSRGSYAELLGRCCVLLLLAPSAAQDASKSLILADISDKTGQARLVSFIYLVFSALPLLSKDARLPVTSSVQSLLTCLPLKQALLRTGLFEEIRKYLLIESMKAVGIKHQDSAVPLSRLRDQLACAATDMLFQTALLLVQEGSIASKDWITLLMVPGLTAILSVQAVQAAPVGLISQHLISLMPALSTPIESIAAGYWITGNLIAMLSVQQGICPELQLAVTGLLRGSASAAAYTLPGILTGKAGVFWQSPQSTSYVAVAIPAVLVMQYACLYDSKLISKLWLQVSGSSQKVEIDWKGFSNKTDNEEVRSSLSQTSASIVKSSFTEQQAASTWFTAKWAEKVATSWSTSLGGWFSKKAPAPTNEQAVERPPLNEQALGALAELWCHLLPVACYTSMDSLPWKAITGLCFSTSFTQIIYLHLLSIGGVDALAKRFQPAEHLLVGSVPAPYNLLFAWVAVLRVDLLALDDIDLYQKHKPLPLDQWLPIVRGLKILLFRILQAQPTAFEDTDTAHGLLVSSVAKNIQAVLLEMYTRWARKPYSASTLWTMTEAERLSEQSNILYYMPYTLSFHQRMVLVRRLLDNERLSVQGSNDIMGPSRSRGKLLSIHRNRLLETSMASMSSLSPADWKDRLVIRYINAFGEAEAGIDAGGLFKDFLTDLSKQVFDPAYGLFSVTSDGLLYPNPAASVLYGQADLENMYAFMGRILGKALFENISLAMQFAFFFLSFMHGRYNFTNLINDLYTFDQELFKNLTFLKTYDGNVEDLALTFSVSDSAFGGHKEIDLIPNGKNINVTASNRHRYINMVAKYYLHDRIRLQAGAFFRGLHEVITTREVFGWFCAPEMQILISGSQAAIDLEDFKAHTRYAGYNSLDSTMRSFWAVMAEFTEEERSLLLQFVTACPRPPSLGFAALNPPFTIQRVDADDQRLPTASTCFNILKLPAYSSKKVLKERLLASITSKAGFDLS